MMAAKLSRLAMLAAMAVPSTAVASLSAATQGAGYSVPWLRIILSLLVCFFVAAGAILLLRAYQHKQLPAFRGGPWSRRLLAAPRIEVVETRRVSAHADICLLRHDGEEYLVLVGGGHSRVLSRKPCDAAVRDEERSEAMSS